MDGSTVHEDIRSGGIGSEINARGRPGKKTRAPLWGARQPKQPNLSLLCARFCGALGNPNSGQTLRLGPALLD
jgi:hypothetical protein